MAFPENLWIMQSAEFKTALLQNMHLIEGFRTEVRPRIPPQEVLDSAVAISGSKPALFELVRGNVIDTLGWRKMGLTTKGSEILTLDGKNPEVLEAYSFSPESIAVFAKYADQTRMFQYSPETKQLRPVLGGDIVRSEHEEANPAFFVHQNLLALVGSAAPQQDYEVFFRPGSLNPETPSDYQLLARFGHRLTSDFRFCAHDFARLQSVPEAYQELFQVKDTFCLADLFPKRTEYEMAKILGLSTEDKKEIYNSTKMSSGNHLFNGPKVAQPINYQALKCTHPAAPENYIAETNHSQ